MTSQLKKKKFIYLAVPVLSCGMWALLLWHVKSSFLTRDGTGPRFGSSESKPLDHQVNPSPSIFTISKK